MAENNTLDISRKSESKGSSVRWHDEHVEHGQERHDEAHTNEIHANEIHSNGTHSNEDDSFLARQKRRISEHPKINKIQLARKTSKHNITFLRQALLIIASSTIFKIVFFLLRLIPISKIVMYIVFFNKCPVEPMIPIYLLVGGILACFRDVLGILVKRNLNEHCLSENEVILTLVAFIYTVGEFVWFIFGSVYVYKNYHNYPWNEKDKEYCSNILYIYSVVVTTISYGLLLLVFMMSCCTMAIARFADTSGAKRSSKT